MSEIVFARDGQALTTSAIIAEGVNVQHKNILAILRDYRSDFEEFGVLAFETRKVRTNGGPQNIVVAVLNEQQATLLVTYCKNTEVVRQFKVALVKAFFEMHERLHPTCPVAATLTIDAVVLTRQEAETFLHVAYVVKYLFQPQYKIFAQLLNAVRSPMTGVFWDAFNDMSISIMANSLARHGMHIEDMNCYKALTR